MPYMRVSVAKKLTEEERVTLANDLGEALEQIPGKARYMLMADIEDGRAIYMGGVRQENFAFVDARYFSNFEYHVKKRFVQAVFAALKKTLGTRDDQMSLTISEFNSWGGFGDFNDERYQEPKDGE